MTRINCVPVEELTRLHLLAEYRELPRVFKLAKVISDVPDVYVLGRGHVRFFYNKLGYCAKRYELLRREMKVRGFSANFSAPTKNDVMFEGRDVDWMWGDWIPTLADIRLNRVRIEQRLYEYEMKKYGVVI